ncbi:tetratricopeptide repeat protein [Actinomadura bangladeshensis]|uniref:Tetratricopeptide repeat protein n=1 Tax=Actinomadura bangladeshensis TaxID=453573 RepID=A0A4R4PCI1_9ACTN|nr:tetratricopeptide repeat protein [Actinomadura bangladeshensis]TDC19694.1 tetratricopeptide repeat protein [Actinomadura bangladeshensis]
MSTRSPFVGSRPFDTDDEALFHGRDEEAAALAQLWPDRRLTVLHGPSGVGKSSLLRAGVLPRLGRRPRVDVLPIGGPAFRADFPLAALPDLNPFTFALLTSWYPDESPTRASGSSVSGLVRRNTRTDRYGDPVPVLAAVDHADLLFRAAGHWDRHRIRFAAELAEAAAQHGLHLLIAVRTENLDGLLGLLAGAGMPDEAVARFPLQPLRPAAARQAVRGPLGGTGHPLAASAPELVDELAAGETHVDPALLQMVCRRLWGELSPESGTGIAHLPRALDPILRDHCLTALARTAYEYERLPSGLTEWFRETFGGRSGGVPQTRDMPGTVLRALEDARLLSAGERGGYRLRQARLRPVVRDLGPDPASAPPEPPRLDAAETAFTSGEPELARRRARAVAAGAAGDARLRGAAECLLGTIAYHRGGTAPAVEHYEKAVNAFGAAGDTVRVGMLLAAIGRLRMDEDAAEAVNRLRAALTRLPGDLFVRTSLAQALWYAGRTQAAIAVLDDALSQDGGVPEALRLRGELLADLNRAEPALRDLDRVDHGDRPSTRAAWALARRTRDGPCGLASTEELELAADADDSGPVLLRVARVLRLGGAADTAAGLARRAVNARRPPLPRHLHKEAERLMTQ